MKATQVSPEFDSLLEYLKNSRGFDFTGYKRPSLIRRVNRRMETLGIKSYESYQDYLEVHPDEFPHLFNTILINVTSFFRDPQAWETILRRAVLASTIGTTIEWYDFFLYSTVTGLVFAQLYFPKSDRVVGTLQAFAIYAASQDLDWSKITSEP